MSAYFENFPEFSYDPNNEKGFEFARLQDIKGWIPSSPDSKEQYKVFRLALLKETGATMDSFFLTNYPTFRYKSNTSPKEEFLRLMQSRQVEESSSEYKRAEDNFEKVFHKGFSRGVDKFFRKYEEFNYRPRNESKAEFERLRKYKDWVFPPNHKKTKSKEVEYNKARGDFFAAFINDFTYFFGVGEDIRDWEYLCDILRVDPIPKTVEACKVALEPYYINIFNLYDHVQWGSTLYYHSSQEELTHYSIIKNLVFPQSLAESTCMKVLLRRFHDLDGVPERSSSGWSGVITIDKRRRPRKAPEM